jgi:hypothetical protein
VPNRLAQESSAYLRQHRHNPVEWEPWGEEPWARARAQDRPVLVSIGYSSCHWCHVMERESFEDPEVAGVMNRALVCIKVDREERPDVDQIYMDTVVRLTGSGGWPLNVFCTPDGRPFFGGTYFPPDRRHGRPSWVEVVRAISRLYAEQRDQLEAEATRILEALHRRPRGPGASLPGPEALTALSRELLARADRTHGGFDAAPKFPTPCQLEALLLAERLGRATAGALDHVVFTLKRMARGGIYDQLGGGFHRYSTDERWLVPHFEKMLYDQGQLLRTYAEAYRQTLDPELSWPVEETIEYLEREMRAPDGGFFASQDADSEGEEGRYYVFSPREVEEVLGPEPARRFCEAYGVTASGTFEHSGKSVLEHALGGPRPRFAAERRSLLAARGKRVPPETDPKRIAGWIGYAIGGIASAAAAFDRDGWLAGAERAADFVRERMLDGEGRLHRIWDGERRKIPAFLDDHAALLAALLDLLRAGGAPRHGELALSLAERIAQDFMDPESGELFLAARGDRTLVLRPPSDMDGATPSAAGLAMLGLVRAAELSGRAELLAAADRALATQALYAQRAPAAVPTALRAAALRARGLGLGLILGEPADPRSRALAARARALLGPEDLVVVTTPEPGFAWLAPEWSEGREALGGAPTAYLCLGRACGLPATEPEALELPPGA